MELIKNPYEEMTEQELTSRIKQSWNGDGYYFKGLNFNGDIWVGKTMEEAVKVVLARYGKRQITVWKHRRRYSKCQN